MMKLVPLALAAILASTGLASAQYGGGSRGGGAVEVKEYDRRGGRGDRDWGRGRGYGRGRETVIIRTLAPQYRFVEERGRRCRIVITRKQRANGTIVRTERREC